MPRRKNYAFERNQRSKAKAAKREAKREAKAAAKAEKLKESRGDDVPEPQEQDPGQQKLSTANRRCRPLSLTVI